jgi:hypothetical protein
MEQNHTWEADSVSAAQEIPRDFWNVNVYVFYPEHKSLPPVQTFISFPPSKCRVIASNYVTTASFHIFTTSLFTNDPIIRRCVTV